MNLSILLTTKPAYQVYKTNDGVKDYLVLKGDDFIKSKDKKKNMIAVSVVPTKGVPIEEIFSSRLIDLKDDYKNMTGTDGSKVNWNPIEIKWKSPNE